MSSSVLRFDRFELQLDERRLLRDGQEVPLRGRAFDVLEVLAGQPGRLVSKNELLERVWSGLVVEEGNIAVQIAAVRKALAGDLIATVPGHGYRLNADPTPGIGSPPPLGPLPQPAAPRLFGRDDDLAHLQVALEQPGCVTLIGPGGVGKTVLALTLARAWAQGSATFVDLSVLAVGDAVQPALCRSLGLEPSGDNAEAALAGALNSQGRLLVLDNAEHVLESVAALVPRLVRMVPSLHLLVTSQAPLAVADERVQWLRPLALPAATAADDEAAHTGAVALFRERVRAADSRYPLGPQAMAAVRQLCAQLDGLPLALEMAAARVPTLGLQGVLTALDERFAVLRRGRRDGPVRHRTLHAALDWSFELLSPDDREVFCALGAFAGGFTLELAVAVAGQGPESRWDVIDRIATLVDRSLVSAGPEDPPRYRLLETMRDYALERLTAAGQAQAVRARHAQALLDLVRHADQAPAGPQRDRLTRLVLQDMSNVREAFRWSLQHDRSIAVALSAHCPTLVEVSAWRGEVFEWLRTCEPLLDETVAPPIQALWWRQFSRHLQFLQDPRAAFAAQRATDLARALGDDLALFWALFASVRAASTATLQAPASADATARPAAWVDEMAELVKAHPEWPGEAGVTVSASQATLCSIRGDFEGTLRHRQEELAQARRVGLTTRAVIAELNVGWTLNRLGRHHEALATFRAFVATATSDDFNSAYARVQVVRTLIMLGRVDDALADAPAALAACRQIDWLEMTGVAALLAAKIGHMRSAAMLLGHARQAYAVRGLKAPEAPIFDYRQAIDVLQAHFDADTLARLTGRGAQLDASAADHLLFSAEDADA